MTNVEPHMIESLKEHRLVEMPFVTGGVQAYWIRRPGSGMYSLCVTFLPSRQIALSGDLTIGGRNGCVSDVGYDLAWWTSDLSEDYLCGKFLTEFWEWKQAVKDVAQRAKDCDADGEPGLRDKWQEIADRMESEEILGVEALARAMQDADFYDNSTPGYGYHHHGGWLTAAHQKFRELWLARTVVPA